MALRTERDKDSYIRIQYENASLFYFKHVQNSGSDEPYWPVFHRDDLDSFTPETFPVITFSHFVNHIICSLILGESISSLPIIEKNYNFLSDQIDGATISAVT